MENKITKLETEKIQHIWCSAQITKKMEDVLIGFICNQAQNKAGISEYIIYLSTIGGSPFCAVNLYNFIKSIPQKTTVYNMGNVASAGVTFFLGFQKRIGVPDCSFMVHQSTLPRTALPEQFNVFDINTQKDSLIAIDEKSQKIIHKETNGKGLKNLNLSAIKKDFLKTTTYTAPKAEELGFIDKIELPKLPEAGVIYITDQYLATLQG
jgi:ATP-dependent protease ClpP protease subunit